MIQSMPPIATKQLLINKAEESLDNALDAADYLQQTLDEIEAQARGEPAGQTEAHSALESAQDKLAKAQKEEKECKDDKVRRQELESSL